MDLGVESDETCIRSFQTDSRKCFWKGYRAALWRFNDSHSPRLPHVLRVSQRPIATAGGTGPAYPWWSEEKLQPEYLKGQGDSFFLPGSFPWVIHLNLVLTMGRGTSKRLSVIFLINIWWKPEIPFNGIFTERVYLSGLFILLPFLPQYPNGGKKRRFWEMQRKVKMAQPRLLGAAISSWGGDLSLEATTPPGVIKSSHLISSALFVRLCCLDLLGWKNGETGGRFSHLDFGVRWTDLWLNPEPQVESWSFSCITSGTILEWV